MGKGRRRRVLLSIGMFLLVVCLLGVVLSFWGARRSALLCRHIDVCVLDSAQFGFVTSDVVLAWLDQQGFKPVGKPIYDQHLEAMETFLKSRWWVATSQIYGTMDGVLHVDIRQRKPVARFVSDSGYNFYIDSLYTLLPVKVGSPINVPIITGDFDFDFNSDYYGPLDEKKEGKDMIFIKNLINFAGEVWADDFLRNLVTQIYVKQNHEIELIPRVGKQVIIFGGIDQPYESRLARLAAFYREGAADEWLVEASVVDLRYERQVIVRSNAAAASSAATNTASAVSTASVSSVSAVDGGR